MTLSPQTAQALLEAAKEKPMFLDISTIPSDLAKRILEAGKIEWGTVTGKTDEEHVSDFSNSLRITRENFGLEPGSRALHGCYLAGTETIVCQTGNSPNSATHAQIIAGLWNSVIDAIASAEREIQEGKE